MRCRHAFESASVHANGDVVCSIIDGRGDFVLGNVREQRLPDILAGPRARMLRRLVLSSRDSYCPAIGKHCPLKTLAAPPADAAAAGLRFLAIEPTTACGLRCLVCLVRDLAGDVTCRDAYRDGGTSFLLYDAIRRTKQHAANAMRRSVPGLDRAPAIHAGLWWPLRRVAAPLLRGRIPTGRAGTLPLDVLRQVVSDAGTGIERIDLFNYGEPFLYPHLVEALQHIRRVSTATVVVSTSGMQVPPEAEEAIVSGRLLDWVVFSIDGCDDASYGRYRTRGRFETAFANMLRFHERAAGTGVRVVWQYVVFRWNDRDEQLQRAIEMSKRSGVHLEFDFTRTWGRSRRRAGDLEYLVPYLRPHTVLPGQSRRDGW